MNERANGEVETGLVWWEEAGKAPMRGAPVIFAPLIPKEEQSLNLLINQRGKHWDGKH